MAIKTRAYFNEPVIIGDSVKPKIEVVSRSWVKYRSNVT
jgi:hypothetical protein